MSAHAGETPSCNIYVDPGMLKIVWAKIQHNIPNNKI